MKHLLLPICLLCFIAKPVQAQTSVRAGAITKYTSGAAYYSRPDSARIPKGTIAPSDVCWVESINGPWAKINHAGKYGNYALVRTLRIANKLNNDLPSSFSGANAVVVHLSGPPEDAFLTLSRYLLTQGYTFAQRDKELLFLTCNPSAPQPGITLAISAAVAADGAGSQILLTGLYSNATLEVWLRNASMAKLRIADSGYGPKESPWATLSALGRSMPGGQVGYLHQP